MKVGQIVIHEGRRFQVLTTSNALVLAHSYDENCGIDTTIYVSTSTGKVIATKSHSRRSRK